MFCFTLKNSQFLKDLIKSCVLNNVRIAIAESCTGGMLSSVITSCSGASKVLNIGIIAYSNESKITELGVQRTTIDNFGAVSAETAKQMAIGIINKNPKSKLGIGITGIAGPKTDESNKPIGLVYICLCSRDDTDDTIHTYIKKYHFSGNRNEIRITTCIEALQRIQEYLKSIINQKD